MSDDPVLPRAAATDHPVQRRPEPATGGRTRSPPRAVDRDPPTLSVLITLHTAGRPLRVGEIATRMQVVGPHVTWQVNELERHGLVHRVADPADQWAPARRAGPEDAGAVGRYLREVSRPVLRRDGGLLGAGPRRPHPAARTDGGRPHRAGRRRAVLATTVTTGGRLR
ncbi:MarR family transcriptional regulator [Pseudonocardia alni]|uniref:MarR family transcriptional regulator n=1 Tax=Pseudonocardia alni TaxID=33907 RepID=UPI0033F555BA